MRSGRPFRPPPTNLRPWHPPSPSRHRFVTYASSDTVRGGAPSPVIRSATETRPGFELGDEETKSYWTAQGRHLLRAILRECTYLPDPRAREYIHHYAISRFRKYAWKLWKEDDVKVLGPRLIKKRKEARQSLSLLKHANEGDRKKLLRVLLVTYGRVGKRRRELLAPLLTDVDYAVGDQEAIPAEKEITPGEVAVVSQGSADSSITATETNHSKQDPQLPRFVTIPTKNEDVVKLRPKLNPMLEAIVRSQTEVNLPQVQLRAPNSLYLEFPRYNSWLRPMPQKRIKNMLHKWRADLLARVHAPLPTAEWQRLQKLAAGEEMPQFPIPYRKRAGEQDVSEAPAPSAALTALVVRGTISLKPTPQRKGAAGSISQRAMRKLWHRVFQMCPRMDWDSQRERWKVTWGDHHPASTPRSPPRTSPT